MTFSAAQKNAFLLTEAILAKRETELVIAYREAYKEIEKQLKNLYIEIQTKGIPKKEYFNYMTKYQRLEALQASIASEYNKASNIVRNTTVNSSRIAITESYYRQAYLLEWVRPADSVFVILPEELIQVSVIGTPEVWRDIAKTKIDRIAATFGAMEQYIPQSGTVLEALLNNKTQTLNKLRRTLSQNFIQGTSYARQAKGIKDIFNTSTFNALRIARTEGNRNMNAGALANTFKARSQGIDIVRIWDASLDSRTRASHASADGQREDASGNFTVGAGYGAIPGQMGIASESINCRCSIVNSVDGVEPGLRRARNPVTGETEIINNKTFSEWAEENDLVLTNTGWKKKS